MSPPFARGVLISAPARELALTTPPASVFPVAALDAANLSAPLRDALDLLAGCAPPDSPRLMVARPEIFTHGESLSWLRQAIGGVLDHVALSDGETVRVAPGLRNHVYFYALGQTGGLEALERLERRAPELFAQLASQVNTALAFRRDGRRFAPVTQALVADPHPSAPPELRPIAIFPHSPDASVARTQAGAGVAPGPFERLHYLRLSERALGADNIAWRVSALIADAFADPRRAVVCALPESAGDEEARLGALMRCLFGAGGRAAGGVMANVFYVADDLPAQALARLAARRTLIVDDLAPFARAAPDFADSFERVLVYALPRRHMPAQFHDLLHMVYGPRVEIDWLRPERTQAESVERTRRS